VWTGEHDGRKPLSRDDGKALRERVAELERMLSRYCDQEHQPTGLGDQSDNRVAAVDVDGSRPDPGLEHSTSSGHTVWGSTVRSHDLNDVEGMMVSKDGKR
jgi:hypothetical protein